MAGIDVPKRVLMVVVMSAGESEDAPAVLAQRQFGTTTPERMHRMAWRQQHRVQQVVMESTAQYGKPVWLVLEGKFRLYLAQAWSHRAPRGKQTDSKDAPRLVRRHLAGELTLSCVPEAEQRRMRSLTRRRTQWAHDRVRTHHPGESLWEETRLKLSTAVSDLFGSSGLRILVAVAAGQRDPAKLAELADPRVQCSPPPLADALTGTVTDLHRRLLRQHLDHWELIDQQMLELAELAARSMDRPAEAIGRWVKIPGIRVLAAPPIVAEAGPTARAFATAARFSSWMGVCPGSHESAGQNTSSRCPKGKVYLRGVLCQVAQAAVRTKNSFFQLKFQRLVGRLGYVQAIWAIARHLSVVIWKILHDGVPYIEHGLATTPQAAQRRLQRLQRELRMLGWSAQLTPLQPTQNAATLG